MPLTEAKIRALTPAGRTARHLDSHGLYLEISSAGSKSWRYRYEWEGKESKLTLGRYPAMSLKEARQARDRIRQQVAEGTHPGRQRVVEKARRKTEQSDTFRLITEEWLARVALKRSGRYIVSTQRAMERHVYPLIGELPVREVTSAQVLAVLHALEDQGIHTTALMVRQWISAVYRYAIVSMRAEVDPAAPLRGVVQRPPVAHAQAMSVEQIGDFLSRLSAYGGHRQTAIALKLLLYTFVRTIELRGAPWEEVDRSGRLWTIPQRRMKMKRVHVVPLSRQACELLEELHHISGAGAWLFPNSRDPKRPMTGTTVNRAIEYLGYPTGQLTGHDFRATASTHLNELGYRPDVIERQLAHVEGNSVRRAYNHAEYLQERTKMMQAWADFVDAQAAS